MPPLTIHHLQYSQSERLPWLLEELRLSGHAVPHTLTLHQRAPWFSPPALAALHPMRAAPVLQDGDLILAESGACIEYLIDVYAPDSKLKIRAGQPGYVQGLYWWHWANSNLQPVIMRCVTVARLKLKPDDPNQKIVDERLAIALGFLDRHLSESGLQWLAGPEGGFSIADVMIVFSLTTMRRFLRYSLAEYEGIMRYLERVSEREGYQEAMKVADPEMDWREAMKGEAPRGFGEVTDLKANV